MGVYHEGLGVLLLCDNQLSMKIAQKVCKRSNERQATSAASTLLFGITSPGEGEEKVESGEMEFQFVSNKAMVANQLTKNIG